jgi:CBS domain-containing protein
MWLRRKDIAMRVSEVMTYPVMTCPAGSALNAAARLMWEHDIGVVPIVDFEGRLTGIVTDRDICMAAYTQGKRLDEILVDTAMAKDVLACHMNDSVDALEELIQGGRVRRIPVVDNDRRPVGIVALNDLARLAVRARKSATDRELIATIAAVCEPRVPLERIQMNHSAGLSQLAS